MVLKFALYACIGVLVTWGQAMDVNEDGAKFEKLAQRAVKQLTMEPRLLQQVADVIHDVEEALFPHWQSIDYRVVPFGSVVSGVPLRDSDIDMTVLLNDTTTTDDIDQQDALIQRSRSILRQHPDLFHRFHISKDLQNVILKFYHRPSGIPIDFTFNKRKLIQNSYLVRYMIHLDRRVYLMAILIKQWGRLRGVKIYNQFANYHIIMLVIFYLQQRGVLPPVAQLQRGAPPLYIEGWNMAFEEREFHTNNTESLLVLLGGFFEYYEGFDYRRYAISIMTGYPVERVALQPGSELQLPPELAAYRDHTPIDTSSAFLMLQCFDFNHLAAKKFNLEQFKITAEAYRKLKSTDFLEFLLTERKLSFFKTIR